MSNGYVFDERIRDAAVTSRSLTTRLYDAGLEAGYTTLAIKNALAWVAIQLDPEADDYETWETTMFARLENPDKEER